jgi:hypothetical protein
MTKAPASLIAVAAIVAAILAFQTAPGIGAAEDASCSTALATASTLNAFALLDGASACADEDRQEDSNLLTVLAQTRALADLLVFASATDETPQALSDLQIAAFYHFGGTFGSFEDLYRLPENVDRLEERLRAAGLQLPPDYDPGWPYRPTTKTELYPELIVAFLDQNIWEMRNIALLLQNDSYYEAYRATRAMRTQDSPALARGTPAYEEYSRLRAVMEEVMRGTDLLPPPPTDPTLWARVSEPEPELAARHLATGFNGPPLPGDFVFRSESEARQSWLASALSDQELDALIARTDFSSQVLVAVGFGRMMNASGKVTITELRYREFAPAPEHDGYQLTARIGVVPPSCGVASAVSFPFVVGLVDAGPGDGGAGLGFSTFPDECGPVASGQPTSP